MSGHRSRGSVSRRHEEEDSIIPTTRQIEAFGRKVTATASQLIGPLEGGVSQHYQNALGEINRELRHPSLQRKIFSLSQASPKELVRARSITEIQQRALSYVPDDLLEDIPEDNNTYSLFQGFQATIPEAEEKEKKKKHGARNGRGQRLLEDGPTEDDARPITKLKNEKQRMTHRLEMMGVRKNMCSTEIREIDNKISNLNSMRKIVLDRLAGLEQEELMLEHEIGEAEMKLEDMQEQIDDEAALATHATPIMTAVPEAELLIAPDSPAMDASFMSESIYQKLPSPAAKTKRPKTPRRRTTTHILHEHLQAGSKIRELQAHNDTISALDFDVPFGTMVTAALDDTVRVWDLNAGRCVGLLEGHLSSVRCLQVEDNIVATGSMDASVRLWDLNQADYIAPPSARINKSSARSNDNDDDDYNGHEDELDADSASLFDDPTATRATQAASMRDCGMFTLSAHVAEITALHFHNATLVSGSADKTLRQWDLGTGRCVQTLDVLWAAAQASSTMLPPNASSAGALLPDLTTTAGAFSAASPAWRPSGGSTGRAAAADASADFVGALQCFDAALACGTADGLVRLWDLRSGQVHRSLVGHTGPVTALQFDDVHLVTGSLDRSIRIWDLRTGSIFDAFAYDRPVSSMMFDARRIVAAAGAPCARVYDKTDGSHWDCGDAASGAGADGDEAGHGGGSGGATGATATAATKTAAAVVERVRIKDGYMIEGRRDGVVGAWSC